MFIWGPPRFHRFNHDRRTYPHGKKPSHRQDQYCWVETLSGDMTPSGRTMRPHRPCDPHFWEDAGSFEGDTLWSGGGLHEKFVSDPF